MWPWIIIGVVILLLLASKPALSAIPIIGNAPGLERFAQAIAFAEGFGKPGVIPTLRNNPGDLTDPSTGAIRTYPTVRDGWQGLYRQIEMMLSGESLYYSADMSIAEIGAIYTATEQSAWVTNVSAYLGVSPDTTLREIVGA
jgi:hypothetical protein